MHEFVFIGNLGYSVFIVLLCVLDCSLCDKLIILHWVHRENDKMIVLQIKTFALHNFRG